MKNQIIFIKFTYIFFVIEISFVSLRKIMQKWKT